MVFEEHYIHDGDLSLLYISQNLCDITKCTDPSANIYTFISINGRFHMILHVFNFSTELLLGTCLFTS
jgi:hypothetical protein